MTNTETPSKVTADKVVAKKAPAKKAAANGKGNGPAKKAAAKAAAPPAEAPKVDRWSTTVPGVTLNAQQRKAWLAKVEAHTSSLKAKAKGNYTRLAEAMADSKHATNSWQLSAEGGPLADMAEGTLYAAIRDLTKVGLLKVERRNRSDFYVPVA